MKGNVTQKNAAASKFVKGVLENPNTIRTELSRRALNIDYLTAKESAITLMVLFLVFRSKKEITDKGMTNYEY